VIPIFASTYSVGRSILTLDEDSVEGGPSSIVKIAKDNKLKKVVLVEDNATGFPEAFKKIGKIGAQLIFGIRSDFRIGENLSKIIVFAANDDGIKSINEVHTQSAMNGSIDEKFLLGHLENIKVCFPFYGSFLFKNVMSYESSVYDPSPLSPLFFLEDNGLPFDNLVARQVESFCAHFSFPTQEAKSIFYENRADAEALQTYKIITGRMSGRQKTLSRPELEYFGSREFCWESYRESTT
jgi:DNA polymerase III alpha subunit